MNPTIHPEAQTQTPGLWSRLAWLPIPLLIAAILVLKALDWQTAHESEILMMLCNFVFSTLASLLVVVLFGRSFLARGMPGMLWFGCGVLLWGAAGTVAPALLAHGINVIISVHNILVCLSAFCQLAGLSRRVCADRALAALPDLHFHGNPDLTARRRVPGR